MYLGRNQHTPIDRTFSNERTLNFIRNNASSHTAGALYRKLGCSRETVNTLCRKLGVKPLSGKMDKKKVAGVIEDYFYNKMQMKDLCKKYKLSYHTVSSYIGKYFRDKTDDPVLMVLQSKINESTD